MNRTLVLLVLAFAYAFPLWAQSGPAADGRAHQAGVRIILVRHGETAPDGTRDPALSEAGRARAEKLAALLKDAGVTRILSTNYKRTQGTAAPLAAATGVQVESYDPAAMQALAQTLRIAHGVIVVVGHSNTTPDFVGFLGGDPGSPIPETEYDRFYVVVPSGAAGASTLLLRY